MQFHCIHGVVHCPVCDAALTVLSEQDSRVARVRHEPRGDCSLASHNYRVDRMNGFGEVINDA